MNNESNFYHKPDFPPWYAPKSTAEPIESSISGNDNHSYDEYEMNEYPVANLDEEQVNEIIESAFERLAQKNPDYQLRPDQIAMSKKILLNLLNQSIYVVEAGTGIGKSYAYLIAVFAYSYLTGERVIITTETKNLQMQIFNKDIRSLMESLEIHLPYELALGSSNYFCRLRHEEAFYDPKFKENLSTVELERYLNWLNEIQEGKMQGHIYETGVPFPDSFWKHIGRDPDGCPGNKCHYFSSCNYYRVKATWSNSRIIVTNHYLFLYNLFNDKRTLPPYSAVIFDEAHGLIQSGQNILTHRFSTDTMRELTRKFDSKIKRHLPPEASEQWTEDWKGLETAWNIFFSSWELQLDLNFEENDRKIILENPSIDTAQCVLLVEKIVNSIADYLDNEEDSGNLNALNGILKTLKKALLFFQYYKLMDFNKMVYWGEKLDSRFYLFACNLNIGDELIPYLTEGQVWTSATLGYWPQDRRPANRQEIIKGGYFRDFITEAFGESLDADLETDYFNSPFNYSRQSVLYIPEHLVAPAWGSSGGAQALYEDNLMKEVIELIKLSKGGALVLFTSNYLLNQAHSVIQEMVEYPVFSQLEYGADTALKKFKETPDSVLLGTNSFWQGVDVTGRQLRALIITKMMFTPPGDPVLQARSKILEKKNENPFMKLSLPKSSLMMRQAFGRLIRSEKDKGFIAILDSRILQKAYGKRILANLPDVPLVKNFPDLSSQVKKNSLV